MCKKLFAFFCLALILSTAGAQTWTPPKIIEIVVPYPAGGSTDRWGRVISEILNDHGWNSIVVNKAGADTTIASNYVAVAKPNGSTLYLSGMGFLDANISFKERPLGIKYTETSFTDIAPIGSGTLVLAVANNVPVNNYEEFKAYVRKNPDQFNIGFFNNYIANLFYIWAKKENLPQPKIVMYKGSAPLNLDLVGGHVPFAFDTYNTIAPFHQDKKVKVIAVLDVPGAKIYNKANPGDKIEIIGQRIPEVNMSIYYGVSGPAGMSKEAIYSINQVINQGLKNPRYTKPMQDMHIGVQGGTPADLNQAHTNLRRLFRNAAKELDK